MTGDLKIRGDGTSTDGIVAALASELDRAPSGIAFVYRTLDVVRESLGGEDAVVVVDHVGLGRQAYHGRRGPAHGTWADEVCRLGSVGLYYDGQPAADDLSAAVVHLCSVAMKLDAARHDARHDPLTGLLNRRAFDDLLATSCAQSARHGWHFAVVVVDLNHFKTVNDRFGHARGDAVLRAIGAELTSRVRAGDGAARLGGDEFALVIANGDRSIADVLQARLEAALQRIAPESAVGVAVGVAVAPEDGRAPDELLALADGRLYEAKGKVAAR